MANITIAIVSDALIDLASTKSFSPLGMKKDALMSHAEPLPTWEGGSVMDFRLFPTVDRTGVIGGTVKVQGVLQNKARVNLYYRKSGQLIQSTFTNEIGVFEFRCGLNRNAADYYAVAITDQPFNAQVFDKLQPI